MPFNNGLWGKVMKEKYSGDKELEEWIRLERKSIKGDSNVWKGLLKDFDILGNWVTWKIGNGFKVKIGEDPWIRSNGSFRLLVHQF